MTSSLVVQEEIFGPIIAIISFSSEEKATQVANDTDYGLAAGTIWVNEYRMVLYASPFGGYKDTGIGREMGEEGMEEYL